MKKIVFPLILFFTACGHQSLPFQTLVQKGDSCYMEQDYKQANNYYQQAFKTPDAAPLDYHYSNAAGVAALAGDHKTAFRLLNELVQTHKDWYSTNFADNPDFLSLHTYPQWQALQDTVQQRQTRIEQDYDHELIARLQAIFERDQQPRHAFLFAYQTDPNNTHLRDSLIREMQCADSVNLLEIKDILTTYGFPPKSKVGSNNSAIWLVVQHSDVEYQKACYPMLRDAADQGEIGRIEVAMLEDRIALWVNRPQRYGSQIVEDSLGNRVIYTLQNKDSVNFYRTAIGMLPLAEYAKQMNAQIQ